MLQWNKPKDIVVCTRNWRKICVRSLVLMPYAFNQTGKSGQEALTNFDFRKKLWLKGKLKAWNSCSAYEQTVGLSFITLLGTIMKKEIIKNEDLNLYFYNFSEVLFTELWINVVYSTQICPCLAKSFLQSNVNADDYHFETEHYWIVLQQRNYHQQLKWWLGQT